MVPALRLSSFRARKEELSESSIFEHVAVDLAQAAVNGHQVTSLTSFDIMMVFTHIYPIVPAPVIFLSLAACRREETRSGARLTLRFMCWHTGLKNLIALSYDHGTRIATNRGASQLEKKTCFSRRIREPRT
jgi:hypothetical protein